MRFRDRAEAGALLAERLLPYARTSPIVLGLPRGGVAIAAQVAGALDAPLDIIVVRKLGVPFQPELAMGAIGEDEVRVLNDEVIRLAHVTANDIVRVEAAERAELRRRAMRFRVNHPRRDLRGRTVIIVDDGLATGSTAVAACEVARAMGALHIVVAVPVAPPDAAVRLGEHADEFVALTAPEQFRAVGQFYEHFGQVTDHEVLEVLDHYIDGEPWYGHRVGDDGQEEKPGAGAGAGTGAASGTDTEVRIDLGGVELPGHLVLPPEAIGLVLFAHGSGSSRHSPRNTAVAELLHEAGIGTLLFDLLTPAEEVDRANVFDIDLLADRLAATTEWVHDRPDCAALPLGYFGASTGAGAALRAAVATPLPIAAVVSRGGRPDLAGVHLRDVTTPTLLIVGGRDSAVIDLNCDAAALIEGVVRMIIIPGATHLFEEEGTLTEAAIEAREWFVQWFRAGEDAAEAVARARRSGRTGRPEVEWA
ncbi:MAG: phosphoribosyltransferase [Acidobacteria bacterium]|nr:phosphoribosyltransferase [Acidobacteriota bacterium]